ncbi:MAG: class I SAM-dependent methyltransferase [Betaproteobacteria bacterium]|nr:class I SAM-dependent methyltransferase [Betaproteobacteria bacterium]
MVTDTRTLFTLVRGLPRKGGLADRLGAFYGPQAHHYDDFRERLLHGRDELVSLLPVRRGGVIVEMGGGTGRNVERFGPRLARLKSVHVVDLCRPLLEIARQRAARLPKLLVHEGDAGTWRAPEPVDAIYFSYSLTMMPDWRAALDNAIGQLKPGGTLGVVDFYVSAERAEDGLRQHTAWTRAFWPRWFGHDGVRLSPEPLACLRSRLDTIVLAEHFGSVPWLPCLRVPYYIFVGRLPARAAPGRFAGRRAARL